MTSKQFKYKEDKKVSKSENIFFNVRKFLDEQGKELTLNNVQSFKKDILTFISRDEFTKFTKSLRDAIRAPEDIQERVVLYNMMHNMGEKNNDTESIKNELKSVKKNIKFFNIVLFLQIIIFILAIGFQTIFGSVLMGLIIIVFILFRTEKINQQKTLNYFIAKDDDNGR